MAVRKLSKIHPGAGRWGAQWVLPGLVFLMVLSAFVLAAFWKNVDVQRRAQFEMRRASERVGTEVAHRFQHAARGLGSARAMLASGLAVDRTAFRGFVRSLDLAHEYPGLQSVGLLAASRRQPEASVFDSLLVQYTEPDDAELMAGQSLEARPGFLVTAQTALISGRAQWTAAAATPTVALQGPSVWLFMPLSTLSSGRDQTQPLVVAHIVLQELLAGLPDVVSGLLSVELSDVTEPDAEPQRLFVSDRQSRTQTPRYASQLRMPVLGHELQLQVNSQERFNAGVDDRAPWVIAVAGLLVSTLLALYLHDKLVQQATMTAMVVSRTKDLDSERLRLRTILETASDGIHILDTQGRLVEANPAFLRMLGLEASAIGHAHVTDWDVGERDISSEVLNEARQANGGALIETRNRRRGGDTIDVEVNVCGLTIDGEALLYCASRDVTERNRVRRELARSEDFKKGILDSLADAVVVVDSQGVIEASNQAWRRSFDHGQTVDGPAAQEAPPVGARYRLPCRSGSAVVNADLGIQAVLAGQRAGYSLKYQCVQPHRQRWLRLSVTPLVHGGHRHAVIVHQDITQQRHLEQERSKAQDLLQNVSNRSPGMLYEYRLQPDGSSSFSYASEGIYALYGVGPHEARADARAVFDRIHPQDREQVVESLLSSAQDRKPRIHEYRVLRPDGQVRWLLDNSLAQTAHDGRTLWHGFVTDVTERKRAELELLRYQKHLKDMVAEGVKRVQTLSVELASAEARERRQLSEDLHDNLGQALALVRFKLRSLTARDGGDEVEGELQQQLGDISEQVEHAIQNVRTLTAQLWPPVLYRFGLGPALEWLAGEMESHYGLSVRVQVERLGTLDEVTSIFLFRAARELLYNVWKHAQVSQADLQLRLDQARHELLMRVSDQGVGFDVQHAQDPATNRFGLFSLGERIRLIGGSVQIDSIIGRGTVVTIVLPVPATGS